MRVLLIALVASGAVACKDEAVLPRELSSFEVTITSSVGSADRRCLLPGTPADGVDLTGCPDYLTDALGNSVARVFFTARAVDLQGELLETYNSRATVRVVPGTVDAAFRTVQFRDGLATGIEGRLPEAAFRGSFGDTYLWLADENPPARASETPGLGSPCGFDQADACFPFGLICINTTPAVGFDPSGLAYCSFGCEDDSGCPDGYSCQLDVEAYSQLDSPGACTRVQPTYAAGATGPIYLISPNISDVNRSESLLASPFQEQFVEVKRGNMVITGVRIDGFYVTDTCAIPDYPGTGQALCTEEERAQVPEFNHLFVFNFSRPDDLFVGDRLSFVSGPVTEFVGLSELSFPLWEVDYDHSPQPDVSPISLHRRIVQYFPKIVEPGEVCASVVTNPLAQKIIECDLAMERLEGARVSAKVKSSVGMFPSLERFGQWPVIVDDGTRFGLEVQIITRENIPFFDPVVFGIKTINATITGNLRQVAFPNSRDRPTWIIEPRDQTDCPWCTN